MTTPYRCPTCHQPMREPLKRGPARKPDPPSERCGAVKDGAVCELKKGHLSKNAARRYSQFHQSGSVEWLEGSDLPRNSKLWLLRWGDLRTYAAIARELGMNPSRVSELDKKMTQKLTWPDTYRYSKYGWFKRLAKAGVIPYWAEYKLRRVDFDDEEYEDQDAA